MSLKRHQGASPGKVQPDRGTKRTELLKAYPRWLQFQGGQPETGQNCGLPLDLGDSRCPARRVLAQVGKSLVSRHQPAPLTLDLAAIRFRPTFPASLAPPRGCVVTADEQQVGDLPGQVFIDLESRTHWPLTRWSGMKSVLLTASAANFRAALVSSALSSGRPQGSARAYRHQRCCRRSRSPVPAYP
jgi:hypothetical protein